MKSKELSKPAKIAATHALKELDFTYEQIAEILGIGIRSAKRYITEVTDKQWHEFGTNIKKLISIKEEEIASKALALIEEKMPKAQFRDLVGLYKIIRELQRGQPPLVAQQFIGGEMQIEFIQDASKT
ncbi:MAG: hypothetical protein FJ044_03210 [Candidatus Cloacimonetes bacterium]|nr:hypothetical protein [Candidatus Cloacimonadota bacterium]